MTGASLSLGSLSATISYPYDERVIALFAAETKTFPRAQYVVSHDAKQVIFTVSANDATALRAALTTITRVLSVWESSRV